MSTDKDPLSTKEGYTLPYERKSLIRNTYVQRKNFARQIIDTVESQYSDACYYRYTPKQFINSLTKAITKHGQSYEESYQKGLNDFDKLHGKQTAQNIINDPSNYYLS